MKRMLVNLREPEESRIAVMDDGRLEEIYVERADRPTLSGNVYLGRVVNVEPGIQAAFVDLGLPLKGFLHASDVVPAAVGIPADPPPPLPDEPAPESDGPDAPPEAEEAEAPGLPGTSPSEPAPEGPPPAPRAQRLPIQALLKRGDDVLVQVTKESLGKKGPALSCQISLPGRYLVLMPFLAKRGVSRKIEDEAERKRLKDLLEALPSPAGLGLIVRTAGAERRKTDLLRDLRYLLRVWGAVERDRRRAKAPSPLYLETELVVRTMRDLFTPEIETVWVDTPEAVRKAREFFRLAMPRYESRVKLYDEPEPIFQKFQVERELARVVDPRVPLESGGGIVIDQTEAMVAIDVNSGRFTDAPDAEETAFRINREAAAEIARQIRVRDLGGLIVVDFIDMRLEKHRREVERVFRESLRRDRARLSVLRMSRFCLIEITRQRMRPALASVQTDACPSCGGTGRLVNRDTLAVRILRQLRFHLPKEHVLRAEVHAHRDAAFFLLNEKRSRLLEIEQQAGKRVSVLPREGRFEDFEIRAFGEGDRPVRL